MSRLRDGSGDQDKRQPVRRPDDSCPACGARDVYALLEERAHGGPVYIDGCAKCCKAWERETRAVPAAEPCTNCAWLPGSPEVESGEIFWIEGATVYDKGIFYCHRRVPFDVRKGEAAKKFEHQISADKKRCTNASVCAGWIRAKLDHKRIFGSEEKP